MFAERPALAISSAMSSQNMYMSATVVTPAAISSARASPVPARTARPSSLSSAGKIHFVSQVWRSQPPP